MKSYKLFFNIEFLDQPVLTQMRLKTQFKDQDGTTKQDWGSKRVISKFRDRDDTAGQVLGPTLGDNHCCLRNLT